MSEPEASTTTASEPLIRTYSLMALASGFASLASVGGCALAGLVAYFIDPTAAIVIFVAPVAAILGAILGALALRSIRLSRGQLGGRPLATIGLFVGLCAAVLQLSVALSALATIWPVRTVLTPAVDSFMLDLSARRMDAARARLSQSAAESVDEGGLASFVQLLEHRLGPYQSASFGLDVFVENRKRLQSLAARGATPGAALPANTPKPVGLTFATSRAFAQVFVEQDQLTKGNVRIDDVLVLMPDDRGVVLRADGDAAKAALALGIALVTPEEAAP